MLERVINERSIEAPTLRLVLDKNFYATLIGITPSVKNLRFFKCHTTPTTITDFVDGQQCQDITLLGTGNTTITNGTKIKTNTGANKVLTANKVYRFTRYDNVWYEDA